jgi:hypothetical protein
MPTVKAPAAEATHARGGACVLMRVWRSLVDGVIEVIHDLSIKTYHSTPVSTRRGGSGDRRAPCRKIGASEIK